MTRGDGAGVPEGTGLADGTGLAGLADLGLLTTEEVRPELDNLDLLSASELVALMAADSRRASEAVAAAAPAITSAVALVCRQLQAGGQLVYVGAGTAGRLAVLDAAELGATFSVPDGVARALIAGGDIALRHPVEGAEDDRAAGAAAVGLLELGEHDVVIGVSASGRTPYVLGALERARACGAATIGLACNRATPLAAAADLAIEVVVGGEVVAGSSRLNAGTAQKITLNTISTSVMVLLGKTYGNLMVDVRATNTKLRDRAARIVQAVTGVSLERAVEALETAGWNTKLASLVAARGMDVAAAASVLEEAGGRLRRALALSADADTDGARGPDTGGSYRDGSYRDGTNRDAQTGSAPTRTAQTVAAEARVLLVTRGPAFCRSVVQSASASPPLLSTGPWSPGTWPSTTAWSWPSGWRAVARGSPHRALSTSRSTGMQGWT